MPGGILLFASVLLAISSFAVAQHNYYIPVDNWTYVAIRDLQTSGYLLDLSPGFKPYRRLEVAQALQDLLEKGDTTKMPEAEKWMLEKLQREFSYEMRLLSAERSNPDTSLTGARFSEEDFLNLAKGYYGNFKFADRVELRPTLRTEFGFDIGNHLSLYTDATIDQTLKDDTLYTASSKFGLDALHQQAYVQYSDRYIDLTFGRDYLSWGYGENGTGLVCNRYFTGSRFEFNFGEKVFLGLYQAAVFGGPYSWINFENINPMCLNYETAANIHSEISNNFLGVDFSVFWPKGFNIYGELMIDDWQVDHKAKGDLKPNLYAIQSGIRATNILQSFRISGTDVGLQYAMAGNRVYDEYNWSSYQKLLLRNYPIANPYGDDFWDLNFLLSQWLSYDWKVTLELTHLEHGSSNMYSFYTMPWLTDPAVTVQTGYHEPFPYGVIRETNLIRLDALYQPAAYFYGSASVIYGHDRNTDYVSGVNRSEFSFLITFYYNFSYSFLFH